MVSPKASTRTHFGNIRPRLLTSGLPKQRNYYCQRSQEMLGDTWKYRTVPKWDIDVREEENRPQSEETEDAKRWGHLVSEREMNQIRKHIHRAEGARGLRDHENQLLPRRTANETLFPKTFPLEKDGKTENVHRMPKTKTKKHQMAWAKGQMKKHRDRLIRGRELAEQRNHQRGAEKLANLVPPLLKPRARKEEGKDFERVTAYPIAQPRQEARIEVTVLMEKPKENKVKKPLRRQFLSIPPFLKCWLENNKAEIF